MARRKGMPRTSSALRIDNRDALTALLTSDPRSSAVRHRSSRRPHGRVDDGGFGAEEDDDDDAAHDDGSDGGGVVGGDGGKVGFRQRLVFGSSSLRSALLRHVLKGDDDDHAAGGGDGDAVAVKGTQKKKPAPKGKPKATTPDEEHMGCIPSAFRATGTRVLLREEFDGIGVGGAAEDRDRVGGADYSSSSSGRTIGAAAPRDGFDGGDGGRRRPTTAEEAASWGGDGFEASLLDHPPGTTSLPPGPSSSSLLNDHGGFNAASASAASSSIAGSRYRLIDPRDESDGAEVVTYFVNPGGDHSQLRATAASIRWARRAKARSVQTAVAAGSASASSYAKGRRKKSGGGGGGGGVETAAAGGAAGAVGGPDHHRIVFVPTYTCVEERILADEGILLSSTFGAAAGGIGGAGATMMDVSIDSLPIDLIPLDSDVWSLEWPFAMKDCNVLGTPGRTVDAVARSLDKLQALAGGETSKGSGGGRRIGRVQALGPLGEAVVGRLLRISFEEEGLDEGNGDDEGDGEGEEEEAGGGKASGNVVAAGDRGAGPPSPSSGAAGRPSEPEAEGEERIDAVLILDRSVDLVTPMLTPLTYEGLLDDVLGIDSGTLRVAPHVVEPPDDDESGETAATGSRRRRGGDDDRERSDNTGGRTVALPLNDSDPLYAEVRDMHVETFGSFLRGQAQALRESHSAFTARDARSKDLHEIHRFVKQIPVFTRNLRSLTNHIHLAELVKSVAETSDFRQRWQTERSMLESESCLDVLEDLVANDEPPYRLLRLLCLQSLTGNGIKSSRYDALRREVVQTYGYPFLLVLSNLEKVGLIKRRETLWGVDAAQASSSPFASLRRSLDLIRAEVDPSNPDDCSYVSSGYAPLSVRIVQAACTTKGWSGSEEMAVLKDLPGNLVDVEQGGEDSSSSGADVKAALRRTAKGSLGALAKARSAEFEAGSSIADGTGGRDAAGEKRKPVLVVYFVGGVTHMEIAALRFLGRKPTFPYDIVICTTKVVNGGTMLRSLA